MKPDRSCPTTKVRYPDRDAVDQYLAHYRATKGSGAPRMKAYECADCGGWHLSKWQQWTPRKVRRRKGVVW